MRFCSYGNGRVSQNIFKRGGAYWLIDAIRAPHRQANASWQIDPRVNRDPMLQQIQFWKLTVNDDQSALLVCERDEGDVAVHKTFRSRTFHSRR